MRVDGRHEVVEEGGLGVEETDAVEGPAEMPVRGVQEPHDAVPPRMCAAPRRRFPLMCAHHAIPSGRTGGAGPRGRVRADPPRFGALRWAGPAGNPAVRGPGARMA
ncbi:hypothetical protein GCM10010299_38340 [Streptomyces tanashiensis]|nr:hypothetical protein GCM10010299_38340 [Streptomyces tanashiensis]